MEKEQTDLKAYVRDTLFHKVKFIVHPKQLQATGKIAGNCMKHQSIPLAARLNWWESNKKCVNDTVRQKRGTTTNALKEEFLGT